MKKMLAVSLAIVMFSQLAGCGAKKNSVDYTEDGRMIITIANSVAITDNSPVEQYLEDKYNVEIKTYGFGTNYYDKLATMFASKNIPDVMFINDISNWEPLAKQGILASFDLETVKKAAPDHWAHVNEKNDRLWELGKLNGKYYAIPKTMGEDRNTVMFWNKEWLDNVGISKIPETIEECDIAFDRIVNNDPDKDGKKDTYALSGVGGNYYRQFDWVFGAYGVMPEQWTVQDGKVINGTVTDNAKEALTKLNEWYSKGYINPEYLTDNEQTMNKRFHSEGIACTNSRLGVFTEYTNQGKANIATMPEGMYEKQGYGPLPAGPRGERGDWLWGPLSNFVCFGSHLEGNTEKQEVILRILNDINSNEETAIMVSYGIKGESWEYGDEAIGKESGIVQINNYGKDVNKQAEMGIGFFNLLICGDFAYSKITDQYQNQEYREKDEELANWGGYNDAIMRANTASTLSLAPTLQQMKIVAYSEFINGTRSLNDWDKFVEEYMNAGGAVLQQEAQEYYDTVIKK